MAKAVQLKDKNGNKCFAVPYFPIGSIYLTVGDYDPSKYFGGKWEKISGGYLYSTSTGAGQTDYTGWGTQSGGGGNTGSTILTAAQSGLRSHTHDMVDDTYGGNTNKLGIRGDGGGSSHWVPSYSQQNGYSTYKPGWTGGWNAEKGHNHTLSNHTHKIASVNVFVWKRIA